MGDDWPVHAWLHSIVRHGSPVLCDLCVCEAEALPEFHAVRHHWGPVSWCPSCWCYVQYDWADWALEDKYHNNNMVYGVLYVSLCDKVKAPFSIETWIIGFNWKPNCPWSHDYSLANLILSNKTSTNHEASWISCLLTSFGYIWNIFPPFILYCR